MNTNEVDVESTVVVSLVPIDGNTRVAVSFGYLHADVVRVFHHGVREWDPLSQMVMHRVIMSSVRGMLRTLTYLELLQRRLERHTRAIRRATGCDPHCRRLIDPLVYHDVNTLFLGCTQAVTTGTPRAWLELGKCEGCGHDAWAPTCTPPRPTRPTRLTRDDTLVRDTLDHVVAFCWTCLARRDLTHKAPQYWV